MNTVVFSSLSRRVTIIILLLVLSAGAVLAEGEGALIVYRVSRPGEYDQICVGDPANQSSFCLTDNTHGNNLNPRWSPDRKTIAFNSDRTGFFEIYLMNADGSDQRQLTELQSPGLFPGLMWDTNGEQILIAAAEGAHQTTYLVSLEGDLCMLLAQSDSGVETNPSCISSDDRFLLDLFDGTAINVFSISQESSELQQLTTADEGGFGGSQLSPDGEYVALLKIDSFSDESINNPQLYLMKSDGTELHHVADLHIPTPMFGWSPDSTQVAYTAYNEGDQRVSINIIGIHDSAPQQITDGTTSVSFGDWSPDGQQIVFSRLPDAFSDWQLVVMNPDGTDQQVIAECGRKECNPDW